MQLEIKKYPDPILRKKAEKINEITQEIKKICEDMAEVMVEQKGIGLAAPQIGESKRILAIRTENGPEVFLNPKIIKKSKETEIGEEGCLSFPGLFLKNKRAKKIEIQALDVQGEEIQIKAGDLMARVFQHEIDHLNGILFIDRLGFWQRLRIRKKLKQHGFYR
jgi:peptide deformylase